MTHVQECPTPAGDTSGLMSAGAESLEYEITLLAAANGAIDYAFRLRRDGFEVAWSGITSGTT